MRLGGSALVDLGGLTPEPTELVVLFALCGGMGTGLRGIGAMGSIALGFVSLDSTEKKTASSEGKTLYKMLCKEIKQNVLQLAQDRS